MLEDLNYQGKKSPVQKDGKYSNNINDFLKLSFNLDSVDFYLLINACNQWLDFFNWVDFMSNHDLYNKCKF